MSEHTKGPWNWNWFQKDGLTDCGIFSDYCHGIRTSVARAPKFQTESQWRADACLIAAAPELLEALEDAMKTAMFEKHADRPWHSNARKAIAKAKGEV